MSAVGGPGFGSSVSPSGAVMFASLLSRPVVQRVLSTLGPLVIYSALAVFFGWQAVGFSGSSSGGFVCGWLSLVCLLIVGQEVRWCLTGRQ